MRRRDSINLLREINQCIPEINFSFLLLTENKKDGQSKKGDFQLHINGLLDEKTFNRLRLIVEKHRLLLERNRDMLVIYTPKIESEAVDLLA